MNVIEKIKLLKSKNLSPYFTAIILSTLMMGYAPSSMALGIFVLYTSIKAITRKNKFEWNYLLALPILIYVYFSMTYFWSIDQGLTLKGMGRMLGMLIIPLIFCFTPRFTKQEFNITLNIYTITNICIGLIFLITSAIRYFNSNLLSEFTYHDLVSDLNLNAIYVAIFYLISFFYLITIHQKKWAHIVSATFLFCLIILLSSKIATLCLFIGLFFYPVHFFWKRIKISRIIIIVIFGSGFFFLTSSELIIRLKDEFRTNIEEVFHREKFNKIYPWTGASIRLLQLRILKEQVEEENIFWKGFGLFASRDDLKKRHVKLNTYQGYHTYNYHNNYAQTFSESGIVGLLLLLILLVLNFIRAIRAKSFLFLMFGVVIVIWFFTESVFWVQRGLFFFMVFFCLFNKTDFASGEKLALKSIKKF